jgi:hypothetical protein
LITLFAAQVWCVLAVLAPAVLALQPIQAAAQVQLESVQRTPNWPSGAALSCTTQPWQRANQKGRAE